MKLYKDLYVTKTMTEEQRRSSKLQHDFQNLPADVLLQAQRAVIVYDMQQAQPKYEDCHNLEEILRENARVEENPQD